MNREERRKFVKKIKKKAGSKEMAEKYAQIVGNMEAPKNPAKVINDGDLVTIDKEAIMSRANYPVMSESYRKFVESSDGVVYEAVKETPVLIHLKEEPKWLFWSGDLKLAKVSDRED